MVQMVRLPSPLEGLDSLHTYQVSVTPSGGTINPSPMFAGTNNKFNISGLAAGIYTVTVKDQQTLCEQVQRFSIESPTQTLTATTSVRSITCVSGNNDGEIRIENVSGRLGRLSIPYWYDYNTTNSLRSVDDDHL